MSDETSKQWTAVAGQLLQPDGWTVGCVLDQALAVDIAARLNGPSPAEVAALLRDIGHGYCGSCDRRVCLSCSADLDTVTSGRPNGGCFADCKLSAMIKQCEGA